MRDATLTDGERWTRDELAALLERRFSPAAVAGFLAASSRRSAEIRARRPELARTARAWMAAGALAYVPAAALGRVRPARALPWWAASALMLDWHLGMVETEDGRPRALGAGDALTLARVWLVPLAAHRPTAAVCAAAAATDALDGPLARRAGPTRAGRDLEGLADACFAAAALRGLRRTGRIGAAAARAETLRLATGAGYAVHAYFARAAAPDPLVTQAARATSVARATGLLLAGAGRRRSADALVAGASALSVAMAARAVVLRRA